MSKPERQRRYHAKLKRYREVAVDVVPRLEAIEKQIAELAQALAEAATKGKRKEAA